MYKIPTIEKMLKAGMHFGHRTSKWHPKMAPFIFGSRNGVHIIDLTKTEKLLKEAMEYVEKLASEDKTILFVGTKIQVKDHLKKVAIEADMPYVAEKWMGGCLTNFSIIRKLITKYNNLISDKSSGKLEKYTKKERLEFDRTIKKLERKVGGLTKLNKLPDALFVWDIKNESTAVLEAKKKNIPVIAVCDTNGDPKDINYIIPSNDDATKTVTLLTELIVDVIKTGKTKKK